MAENASQSIENPLASGGLKRPPDPPPLVPSTCGARCQALSGNFHFWHLSNFGLDPPNNVVQEVKTHKHLGLLLSENLNWSHHIDMLLVKATNKLNTVC